MLSIVIMHTQIIKVNGSKFWEVMDMFIALIVVMVSWHILACKLIELYIFNR